jgi:hypothetical protein
MKKIFSTSQIVGTCRMDSQDLEACATAEALYDEEQSQLIIELDSFQLHVSTRVSGLAARLASVVHFGPPTRPAIERSYGRVSASSARVLSCSRPVYEKAFPVLYSYVYLLPNRPCASNAESCLAFHCLCFS